jgi:hypothetical protein
MRAFTLTAALCLLNGTAWGALLIPTKVGTTWRYDVTDETGGENAPSHLQILYRINGTQQFGGKELLKFETLVGDIATRTELVAVDQDGIRLFAHTSKDGAMIGYISPQTIVPGKLEQGAAWDCIDEIADVRIHQHFKVAGTEKVSVPAGEFQTVRLHCAESMPISVVIDRWFTSGTGLIKEVSTLRSPTGDLLRRRTLELAVSPNPSVKTEPVLKKLSVGVSNQVAGGSKTEFSTDTQNLYARWAGNGLRKNSKVRAVWIAEDVGTIAPPNYKIDDAVAIASAPDAHGMFTLSRPSDGWAPGNYRVEFYVDEMLVEVVKLQIK